MAKKKNKKRGLVTTAVTAAGQAISDAADPPSVPTSTGGTGATYDSYSDFQAANNPGSGQKPSGGDPNKFGDASIYGMGNLNLPKPKPKIRPPANVYAVENETKQQKLDRLLALQAHIDGGGENHYDDIPDYPHGKTKEGLEKLSLMVQQLELELEIEASEGRIAEAETGLRGKVTESRLSRESAATQALESKLEEATEFGLQARQLVGQQQSQRGMLRSTISGQRLEKVGLKEAEFKEGSKLRTKAFIDEGERREEIMFSERDMIRDAAKQNRLYAELDQTIASIEDINRFETQMQQQQQIAQAQISAQQSSGFASFLGSMVSTVLTAAFFL
jgi:hypothetical protein